MKQITNKRMMQLIMMCHISVEYLFCAVPVCHRFSKRLYSPHMTKKNTKVFTTAKETNIFLKSTPISSKSGLSCTIIGGIKNPSAAPSCKI